MKGFLFAVITLGLVACEGGGSNNTPAEILSKLSVDDVTLFEGSSGTTPFAFTISMDKSFSKPVSVSYSTADGTARGGEDYTAISSQTIIFQPGEVSKTITVDVVGDTKRESAETFTLNLSGVVNGVIAKATGTASIRDDDEGAAFTNLVWSDEFDYTGLPDSKKWSYDVGGHGWGNNELQYYTKERTENARVEGGNLIITARRETMEGREYTSARLVTKNKGDWKYGRIEVKAKLPQGRGIWPAIWMLPTEWKYGDWPASGEIDIMEFVGYEPDRVHGTVHTKSFNHSIGTQKGSSLQLTDLATASHVYAIEWLADKIDFYIDGQRYFTFINSNRGFADWPFDQSFHLLLNVAVGGNWGGAQGVDASVYPQQFVIDYVRVYQ
jgi:beta-glucanase (GH16 family)